MMVVSSIRRFVARMSLFLVLFLVSGAAAGNHQGAFQGHEETWTNFLDQLSAASPRQGRLLREQTKLVGKQHFQGENYHGSAGEHVRYLKGPLAALNLTAPTRKCNEIVAQLSISDLNIVGQIFLGAILPPNSPLAPVALQLFTSTLKYPVQVQKICTSCMEVQAMYKGESFLKDGSPYGFATYCGKKKYAYDVVTSGLLLTPIDPSTGKVFTGKLRSGVFTHGTLAGSQSTASGLFPSNLPAALQVSAAQTGQLIAELLLDNIAALVGASAGAVFVLPDNIGYGESYDYPKSYLIHSIYQQASMTLWLKARQMLSFPASADRSCTELDTVVSVTGYSEGGYSAFSTCLAFNQLKLSGSKVRVLRCQAGGTPFDLDYVTSYTLKQLQNKSAHVNAPAVIAFVGNSYSSTDPDLANSNKGQDALKDAYKKLVPVWLDSPSIQQVVALSSAAGPLEILSASLLDLYLGNPNDVTPTRLCSGPGLQRTDTNFFCQALIDNSLVNALLSADFPTVVCHAQDDRLVPFANIPDFSSNPNVQFYKPSFPQLTPAGNHQGGFFFCTLGAILAFANPANASDSLQMKSDLTDASFCKLPAPTMKPTKPPHKKRGIHRPV